MIERLVHIFITNNRLEFIKQSCEFKFFGIFSIQGGKQKLLVLKGVEMEEKHFNAKLEKLDADQKLEMARGGYSLKPDASR
jgi:hypothetical protein